MGIFRTHLKGLVSYFHRRYLAYKHTCQLQDLLGQYHFRYSSRLGEGRIERMHEKLMAAPPEFKQALCNEFGKAEPYLPISYRIERLERFNKVVRQIRNGNIAAPAQTVKRQVAKQGTKAYRQGGTAHNYQPDESEQMMLRQSLLNTMGIDRSDSMIERHHNEADETTRRSSVPSTSSDSFTPSTYSSVSCTSGSTSSSNDSTCDSSPSSSD